MQPESTATQGDEEEIADNESTYHSYSKVEKTKTQRPKYKEKFR